jgi:putative oxidoreductase
MSEILAAWEPRILSVLRIFTGLLLFAHGTAKILGFPVVPNFANVQIGSLI